ncbi:MAG: Fic family protein [Oscillospiraceae bacterium]|nr:Fic family protein [Oscillospiraceae bacterium]
MSNEKILNMKLPSKLHDDLKQAAQERYISQASLVRMVLVEWVNSNNTKGESASKLNAESAGGDNENSLKVTYQNPIDTSTGLFDRAPQLHVGESRGVPVITNKFNMTVPQNVFLAKRNIVDYIWKSAKLEGLAVTYPDTDAIYNGLVVSGVSVDEILAINNLKHAWRFILDTLDYETNYQFICKINQEVGSGNLIYGAGYLRSIPVTIGGTEWKPDIPSESMVKEELLQISGMSNPTDRAITLMLHLMRRQLFVDGNKRTAMLAANHVMISNGLGIISIPINKQSEFFTLLIEFYELGDMGKIKQFVYDNCIDGADFSAS